MQMADKDKTSPDESGFLARWSRRKREAATRDAEPLQEARETEQANDFQPPEPEEREEEKANREAAESVDIDSLTYESDFSIFMKSGVPEFLRRKAMRKLWTSNPVLANLDGLNDYDEDYADPKFNVFKSAWNVVGGYLGNADKAVDEKSAGSFRKVERQFIDEKSDRSERAPLSEAENEPTAAVRADEDSEDRKPAGKTADGGKDIPRVSLRDRLRG